MRHSWGPIGLTKGPELEFKCVLSIKDRNLETFIFHAVPWSKEKDSPICVLVIYNEEGEASVLVEPTDGVGLVPRLLYLCRYHLKSVGMNWMSNWRDIRPDKG